MDSRSFNPRLVVVLALAGVLGVAWGVAWGQEGPPAGDEPPAEQQAAVADLERFENRPIARILVVGPPDPDDPDARRPLEPSMERLVRNQLRTAEAAPLRIRTIHEDVRRINRLGRFHSVVPSAQLRADGWVDLIIEVVPQPMILDVQPVGNRRLTDQDIQRVTNILIGTPVDRFRIDRVAREIEGEYQSKGYHLAQVTPELEDIEETGILIFRIREGERLRVSAIRFEAVEGELTFPPRELRRQIRTRVAGLIRTGPLDDSVLDSDVDALRRYLRERGYRDARVDRLVTYSPDGREAIVTFYLSQGRRYILRNVIVFFPDLITEEGFQTREEAAAAAGEDEYVFYLGGDRGFVTYRMGVFGPEQAAALLPIKPGDVYSADRIRDADAVVAGYYGRLGYTHARVGRTELHREEDPFVDLLIEVLEGERFLTGQVVVQGNHLTRDNVIRRGIHVKPDRPLDTAALDRTKEHLAGTRLFAPGSVRITVQDPDPVEPTHRDVLVEVHEHNTGSVAFGGAVDSDLGLRAQFSLTQRNFDITDWPDSAGEFFTGRAFRGAGQTMELELLPGDRTQSYQLSFTEPSIMDSEYSFATRGRYFFRSFREYDEERYGVPYLNVGRKFGDRWDGSVGARGEWVQLSDIDPGRPVDVFAVADRSLITSLSLSLRRTTVDPFAVLPESGNRLEFAVERAGALGGDFDFTKLQGGYTLYLPVHRDFVGRATVLTLRTRAAWIPESPGDVPVFERLYLGGHSFRGFSTRAVSPVGIRNDTGQFGRDPVGGTWSFFAGTELRQPVFEDVISVVGFLDTGTVTNDVGFDNYRVSIGTGLRIKVPFSPLPLAFDFGFPLVREPTDQRRIFTFSIDIPFQ